MAGDAEWVISIRRKLENEEVISSSRARKQCIYKVPGWLKDQVCDGNDTTPYTPEIISFGPYHRGDPGLVEMEKHKWRCLRHMLTREGQDVELYLEEMRKLEDDTRACYQGLLSLDSNEFVEMLVLDGCFMLEFLRVTKLGRNNLKYDDYDPVFSKQTIIHAIGRDMIKLENQLPVMVLEKLLTIQYKRPFRDKKLIPKLVLRALTPIWVTNEILTVKQLKNMRNAVASHPDNMMLHCLDIFRAGLVYKPPLNSGEQIPVDVAEVEMSDMSSPSRVQIPVSNVFESVSDQEEQHDQETGRPSVEDVSFTTASASASASSLSNFGLGTSNHSADSETSESYVSSSSSDSDQQEEQHQDAKNKSEMMLCLSNVITKVMNCVRRPKPSYEEIRINSDLMVCCVEDLREAGVKFKTRKSQPFWDITFDKHSGLLEIPPINIDDATKTVFLNLIAYEQCHLRPSREMTITDYTAFMDKLVNSGADVSHLHQAGIIVHQLGSDAEVADLFNRLVKKAFLDWEQGGLSKLYRQLNRYCTHKRYRYCADLRHVYFKNPWVIISLGFAIVLFLLTLAQTFYAIFAYHRPPKSK